MILAGQKDGNTYKWVAHRRLAALVQLHKSYEILYLHLFRIKEDRCFTANPEILNIIEILKKMNPVKAPY